MNPQYPTVNAYSEWKQTSDTDFGEGDSENLTIIGKGINAELQIELSDLQPWIERKPVNKPIERYGHAMAAIDGTDKVVLFGGYTHFGSYYRLNDTWIYDYSDNTWTPKSPSVSPTPRMSHAMATIYGTDKVLLFGGSYDWNGHYDETWVYDLSDDTWVEINTAVKPGQREYHTMAGISNSDKVLMFGGWAFDGMTSTYYDDTWEFDFSAKTWIQKSPSIIPTGRYIPSMASVYNDDKVVLYGGINPGIGGNFTWIYDLSMNNWFKKVTSINPGLRFNHGMASIDGTDKVLLFGGHYSSYNNETWVYDVSDNRWEKRKTKNQPDIRDGSAMAPIYGYDEIILFGGWYYSGALPSVWWVYDDTWIFKDHLPTRNGTYISEPYDTGSKTHFISVQGFTETPAHSSIKLQLRTGSSEEELKNAPYLGPEGTKSSYYNSSTTKIWPGHCGEQWVQYIVYFNMTEYTDSPCLRDLTITYNCLPETELVDPIDGIILTDNKPIFVWTYQDFDSEKQDAFQVLIDDDINFKNVSFNSGEQSTSKLQWAFPIGTNFTHLPDGTWYWKVRTRDIDGTWTEYTTPRSFIIDSRTPTSVTTYPDNNGKYRDVREITGMANDGETGSGLSKVEIRIKNLNKNKFWNGNSWVSITTWLLVSGTTNWIYNTSNIPWESSIPYTIQSRAYDNASNVEQPALDYLFRIDKDSPISNIDIPVENVWINKLPKIIGTARDTGSAGLSIVEICIKCVEDNQLWDNIKEENKYWYGTTWVTAKKWLPTVGLEQWVYNSSHIRWTSGNQYLIQSRVVDNTGNIETLDIGTRFLFDSEPPKELFIYINSGEEYTNSNRVTLSLQATDTGSGTAEMAFSNDDIIWSNWEPFNSTKSFELKTGDGEKIVYFKVRDYAGNMAKQVHDTIILDNTPPKELSIVINKGAQYTNSIQLEFDLYAIDSTSGLGEMVFSFDNINWLTWHPFKNSKSLSALESDGIVMVYFKVRDNAGNIANYVFDTILLDTTEPDSLSLTINHDAQSTNDKLVILDLNAQDNHSGVEMMAFSSDGINWSAWEKYQNSKYYNIPSGEGIKTVYFKVKDRAGNQAKPIKSSIQFTIPETAAKDEQSKFESDNLQNWYILFIIILIILVLIITGLGISIKRKKRIYQELLTTGTLPKHLKHLVPGATAEQIPPATQPAQLPAAQAQAVGSGEAKELIAPPTTSELPALPPSFGNAQEPPANQLPNSESSLNQTSNAQENSRELKNSI